jgi:hypothetical protein
MLPAASVAFQVTVVVPSGNAPGALLVMVTAPLQLSVAVAWPMLPTYVHPLLVPTVIPLGQEMVGACVSLTVIVNEQLTWATT